MDIEKFTDEYFQYKLDTKSFDEEDFWEFIDTFKYETKYDKKWRWSCWVITYCKFHEKFYACEWEQDMQEDRWYGDQPYEVVPKKETIVTTIWERV